MSAANKAKIDEILRQFPGAVIDRDSVEVVLEMLQGDVKAVVNFLSAGEGHYVEDPRKDGLPADYMARPSGFSLDHVKDAEEASQAILLKDFFLAENGAFMDHLRFQTEQYPHYLSVLIVLMNQGVSLNTTTKSRILAAAWARGDKQLETYLLDQTQHIGFTEVLRALKILDAPRRVRAIEKKIERLVAQGTAKPRTIGKLRSKLHDVKQDCAEGQKTSVSGALSRRVRRWLQTIPVNKLNFFALQFPKEPWQEIADIIHIAPKDLQLDWFLHFAHGAPAPADSVVAQCQNLDAANVASLIAKHDIPYSYLRTHLPDGLSEAVKARVVEYEPIDQVVWYYEELGGSLQVDKIIDRRLATGEEPQFSYGKFMERLLIFKQNNSPFMDKLIPLAEKRLKQIRLPLEPPVVVLGDASYSMDVAIRTSTIIASLLCALCNADLRFFNVESFPPVKIPRTVEEVLDVALNTQADGLTAPACTLMEYYRTRTPIKCFIVVTDEIENEAYQGTYFAQLFYKYYTEVSRAKLVMVSFLENPKEKGRMVKALESLGIVPLQFRLDAKRPDLTKLDTLFGLLAAETSGFTKRIDDLAQNVAVPPVRAAPNAAAAAGSGSSEATPTPSPSASSSAASAEQEEKWDLSRLLFAVQNVNEQESAELAQAAAEFVAAARRRAEEEKELEGQKGKSKLAESSEDECGLCLNGKPDTALIECGHLVCSACAPGVLGKACPFCRRPVVRTLQVFKP